MSTKICVYAICKDEEKFADKWFQNVIDADYIAVLDTGSQPKFYEYLLFVRDTINQQVGYEKVIIDQKVIKPWRFDVARNESMKLIPADTDLCLCTDFDELLVPNWAAILREHWHGEPRVLYQYAWTHTATGAPAKIFTYDKCHANDGKHFWKYPVHECISIGSVADDLAEIKVSARIDAPVPFLEHFPDPEKQRQNSYGELLKIRAKEFPDEHFSYTYLVAQLFWEQKFEEVIKFGIETALPKVYPTKDADQATMPDLYLYIGDAYRALGQFDKALEFHTMAISALPEGRDGYVAVAWDYIYLNRPFDAIDTLHRGLLVGRQMHLWCEREFTYTFMPYLVLWMAYKMVGNVNSSNDYLFLAQQMGAPQSMIDDLLSGFQESQTKLSIVN